MIVFTNTYPLTVLAHYLYSKMISIPTNINFFTPTNTYLFWVRTGLTNCTAPVVVARNPDRERKRKLKYESNEITGFTRWGYLVQEILWLAQSGHGWEIILIM